MSKASSSHERLATRIGALTGIASASSMPNDAEQTVEELLRALEAGEVRAAERDASGNWRAVPWVKQGILLGFRVGQVIDMTAYVSEGAPARFFFFDKHTFPPHGFDMDQSRQVSTRARLAHP